MDSAMMAIDAAHKMATHRNAARGIPVSTNQPNRIGVVAEPKSMPL